MNAKVIHLENLDYDTMMRFVRVYRTRRWEWIAQVRNTVSGTWTVHACRSALEALGSRR